MLQSQPKTPEIQRLSLSLIKGNLGHFYLFSNKTILLGKQNYHFYQYIENVFAIIKNGLE